MDELIESGISWNQLLNKRGKNLPISTDPFFNMIRKDRKVRHAYFKDKDIYNVENILFLSI